jgi:hypothetical protein
MRAWLLAVAIALACAAARAQAPELGAVTILEGQALIYRGSGRLHAAEGVRLAAGDIVETGADTFAQVEAADGTVLQLGPSTRLLALAAPARGKGGRSLYLMGGWVKLASAKRDSAAGPGFELRAPSFEIAPNAAVLVLQSTPAELMLFVEAGEARLGERAQGAPVEVSLRSGSFYQRKPPARGAVNAGVPAAFVGAMPRAFRDSLPPRLERFRDRRVAPREAAPFGYADVEAWLKAEPSVRRPLMPRWRPKLRDPAFRAALVANLSSHPEWDPILFPEKYKPKDPPDARGVDPSGRPASAAAP